LERRGPVPGRTALSVPTIWALGAREGSDTDYAARDWTGGLWAGAGQRAEDLLDPCGLLDDGDDAHGTGAAGTPERIRLVHLFDQPCPSPRRT
jgi:hypothetical protein